MTRPLGKDRAQAYEKIMPLISIPETFPVENRNIPPASLFKTSALKSEFWLEIGFGNGEHLTALMDKYVGTYFIGAEPFINGMAAFTKIMDDKPKDKIRVFMDDAMLLIESLAAASIDRIYILNPDPWPKKRHHKRRIVSGKNLDELTRVLKPGGLLLMCTDVDDLAEWMATQAINHPALEWQAESSSDWKNPPAWWVSSTRYAEKGAKAGRKMTYLIFKNTCKKPG